MTVFHARLLAEDLALGIDLIADLVRAPAFDEAELERERQVVLQELGEARDTPDDIVFDHLQEAAFPDQPLGRSILGARTASPGSTPRCCATGWRHHYLAGSCVISAAGKVDHDALVALVAGRFGDLPAGTRPLAVPGRFAGDVRHDARKFEQAHLTLGYRAPGHDDADHDAVLLFATAAAAACHHGCSRNCARRAGWPTASTPARRLTPKPGCFRCTWQPPGATRRRRST